jgi:hypothetical protein
MPSSGHFACHTSINLSSWRHDQVGNYGLERSFVYLFKMADWVNNCPNDLVYGPAAYPLKAAIHILQPLPYATCRRVICGPIALVGTQAPQKPCGFEKCPCRGVVLSKPIDCCVPKGSIHNRYNGVLQAIVFSQVEKDCSIFRMQTYTSS